MLLCLIKNCQQMSTKTFPFFLSSALCAADMILDAHNRVFEICFCRLCFPFTDIGSVIKNLPASLRLLLKRL